MNQDQSQQSNFPRSRVSRRQMFHVVGASLGGVAFLLVTVRQAQAKMTQQAARYQATPKGDSKCSNCQHFQSPASCQIVDGTVSPQGWCQMWLKKQ